MKTYGPLQANIAGNPDQADLHVLFCHGYGAPGTDLVPLAEELFQLEPGFRERVCFLFPQAPHTMEELGMPDGRAWWPLNMARLQELLETNQIEELIKTTPPGLDEAREMLGQFLQTYCEEHITDLSKIVVGGFSQGAMLTTDFTLRSSTTPAGLCLYSGTLICQSDWQATAPNHAGLQVIQTHGTHDPILPFEAAGLLRDLLSDAGCRLKFHQFPGMHTIPYQAISMTVEFLKSKLKLG